MMMSFYVPIWEVRILIVTMVNKLLKEIFELAVTLNWWESSKYKTKQATMKNVTIYVNIITIN